MTHREWCWMLEINGSNNKQYTIFRPIYNIISVCSICRLFCELLRWYTLYFISVHLVESDIMTCLCHGCVTVPVSHSDRRAYHISLWASRLLWDLIVRQIFQRYICLDPTSLGKVSHTQTHLTHPRLTPFLRRVDTEMAWWSPYPTQPPPLLCVWRRHRAHRL